LRYLCYLLFALGCLSAGFAYGQVKVGVLVSATGNGAVIGIPQKNTADLLPTRVGDASIEYIVLDDGGDPAATVKNAKKLMSESKVDALIGPSLTPNALAILDFIAEEKTPLLATVGSAAVIEPMDAKRQWVFKTTQNDDLITAALVEHMSKHGVKTVGFIGFNDAYGESFYRVLSQMAEKNGLRIVANERFLRSDQSVTGQVLKLLVANPDAVFIAATGGPAVLPEATLVDKGYKGHIYQTHGAATEDFIRLGGKQVEGTILAAGPMLVYDEIAADNPIKRVTGEYIATYEKRFGQRPATFGANTYDAGLIIGRAIPAALQKAKPGSVEFRVALREAIEHTSELIGAQGVFNITANNHNGMDARARVLVQVREGKFRLLRD
jgi:branched-chain amino acid transport system substrate-binding protein